MTTSGIYALYWWDEDLVYIGLSQNLEARHKEHLRNLRSNRHTNYKVQDAYIKYGTPDFVVLDLCSIAELPSKEIYWTQEFNAIEDGLCLIEAGIVGFGTNSNASKYSKLQILKTFRLLYLTNKNYIRISELTGVADSTIRDICKERSHLWLKEKYPFQYNLMKSRERDIVTSSLRKQPTKLISPKGDIVEVVNIREFARENNLHNTCLGEVVRGKRSHHKGWVLYK
jgi:hypothetical protein